MSFFKSLKKAFKKIFKGVKKIFKKITKSWIGKIILAAVVIYTGGVLLGAWGSTGPMSGMYGAWGGGAAATSTAAETAAVLEGGTALTSAEMTAELVAINAEATALTVAQKAAALKATEGAVVGATTGGLTSAPILGAEQLATVGNVLKTANVVTNETLLGSLWSGVKSAATLAQDNPIPAMMLMQGVSSALTPDQPTRIDILREEDTLRRERYDRAFSGSFERMPRLSSRTPEMLYQQNTRPWHTQGS